MGGANILASDRNTVEVVWACRKTTIETCLQADNGNETTRKKMKTGDKGRFRLLPLGDSRGSGMQASLEHTLVRYRI